MYHDGAELEEAGKEYQAASKYLDALDQNSRHKKAAEALARIAEEAYTEKLALAQGYETSGRYPKALEEYRTLKGLLERLDDHSMVQFSVIDVSERIEAMANAAAEERYRDGIDRIGARDWETAIRELRGAQSFKAGYKDTRDRIGEAFYGWAGDEEDKKQFRAAAGHYVEAADSAGAGWRDARSRGAVLYARLGRHFVSVDRCRQAVRDLRQARLLSTSAATEKELAEAEECAVTPVAVLPMENPTNQAIAGIALGDTIAEALGAEVRTNASEFVRLLERSSIDSILAEQGLSTSGVVGGTASKLRGVRYLVIGKLTQVRSDRPEVSVTRATTTGQERYDCVKTKSDGTSYKSTCFRDYAIQYADHRGQVRVQLAGAVKVVDVKTGEQLATVPFDFMEEDRVQYATGFANASGGPVTPVARGRTGGVECDSDFMSLVEARRELADDGTLASKIVQRIATAAGAGVLSAIDVERPAADPLTLP